jgi:septin family protein
LKKNAYQYLAQLLIPTNLNKLKWEDELHIYDAYRADLQTQVEFTLEVKRWKAVNNVMDVYIQSNIFIVWHY